MRKKFIYIGLILLAIAVVVFLAFVLVSPFSGAVSKIITTYNVSASSGGFYYVPVVTSNSIRSLIYVALNSSANIYLFNTSTFQAWSSRMQGNATASGLAYARTLGPGSGALIESNVNVSQILLAENLSSAKLNGSVAGLSGFNSTAYVVIDNTNGSRSRNTSVRGVVLYFGLTQSNFSMYEGIGLEALAVGLAEIALVIAGIVLVIYGAIKKDPNIETEAGAEKSAARGAAKGETSKEYIDSLYKNVGRRKK